MTTKAQLTEQAEARETLRGMLKPGDTVSTILRHVSASGMSRSISLVRPDCERGEIYDLTYWAARAMGDKIDPKNGGIKIVGAGTDMGFYLVYNLGRRLWPDGVQCSGEGCHSSDHANPPYPPRMVTLTAETCPGRPCGEGCDHVTANQMMHTDSGYALIQRWI